MPLSQRAMVTNSTANPFPYWDVYDGWTPIYWDRQDGPLNTGYLWVPWPERGAWMIFSYHNGISAGWNHLHGSVSYDMPMATAVWPYNTTDPFYDADNEMLSSRLGGPP